MYVSHRNVIRRKEGNPGPWQEKEPVGGVTCSRISTTLILDVLARGLSGWMVLFDVPGFTGGCYELSSRSMNRVDGLSIYG
ncbi:hypothetical protein BDW42DRAFT_179641 [Aspergillus taichungensis]|uniref:Uncharacterized protein n=1 Tax=Aspergillus taichungensis TaxID=482145 RepID=A0A2J5HG94_9EURO|nr:hypothetical protein BDW42DRAFT_179641 [Aspergillus taichungensis]